MGISSTTTSDIIYKQMYWTRKNSWITEYTSWGRDLCYCLGVLWCTNSTRRSIKTSRESLLTMELGSWFHSLITRGKKLYLKQLLWESGTGMYILWRCLDGWSGWTVKYCVVLILKWPWISMKRNFILSTFVLPSRVSRFACLHNAVGEYMRRYLLYIKREASLCTFSIFAISDAV